jgi:hypothetical protein
MSHVLGFGLMLQNTKIFFKLFHDFAASGSSPLIEILILVILGALGGQLQGQASPSTGTARRRLDGQGPGQEGDCDPGHKTFILFHDVNSKVALVH